MRGEKVEGKPCVKCGETIRYANPDNSHAKIGGCVNCKNLISAKVKSSRNKHGQASIGIKEPYRKCYEQGWRARKDTINPYPKSELGKYCAWQAGKNDNHK